MQIEADNKTNRNQGRRLIKTHYWMEKMKGIHIPQI